MSSSHIGILHLNFLDYTILAIYFVVIVVIGLLANRATKTSSDFFLSARSMPAWITGIAFISANMGALEILGNAANGAQYGAAAVHFFWLGAIPAMVFLGVVMMPFYYSSRVHSVPEYLRRRFNASTHLLNALIFAVGQILIAGINLYALALIIERLLGWPLIVSVALGAAFVLLYILLGGLSAAMYGEVLQFFVILAGLAPIVALGLHHVGGWHAVAAAMPSPEHTMTWEGTQVGHWRNPLGDWIGLAMGEGFLLAFGYWTTNFAEVQRALSASSLNAAHWRISKAHLASIHGGPWNGRVGDDSRIGYAERAVFQSGHSRTDATLVTQRRPWSGGHGAAGRLHGRHGRQYQRLQYGIHLRSLETLHVNPK